MVENGKKLIEILDDIKYTSLYGELEKDIANVVLDSREVRKDDVFVALRGAERDGHLYIYQAIEKGAKIIFLEDIPLNYVEGITYVQFPDTKKILPKIAYKMYDNPSAKLDVVGVTGTNGKTTVATLLYQLFREMNIKAGLISTVEIRINDKVIPSTHTTPDVLSINRLLAKMYQDGCEFVFMEVSSHSIDQARIEGLVFRGGVFTNISHDHLDYHVTFQKYIEAKKGFFDSLSKDAFGLTNKDDKRGEVMLQNCKAFRRTYSLHNIADYRGKLLSQSLFDIEMEIERQNVFFPLTGRFNAYNVLAVFGVAKELGFETHDILKALSMVKGPRGRMQKVVNSSTSIIGIVDYAHTPDSLLNVLKSLKEFVGNDRQIITVIGCGGNRDKEKRPMMAQIAQDYSSQLILTADNPRNEDVEEILDDMEEGLIDKNKFIRISSRKEAIKTAVMLASNQDIVLVAGKGHETYQEINGVKYPFDDKKVLQEALTLRT